MSYTDEQKEKIIYNFLDWCEKIGYSGKEGIKIVIIDGLPICAERPVQSLRFDVDGLTGSRQNTTIE